MTYHRVPLQRVQYVKTAPSVEAKFVVDPTAETVEDRYHPAFVAQLKDDLRRDLREEGKTVVGEFYTELRLAESNRAFDTIYMTAWMVHDDALPALPR